MKKIQLYLLLVVVVFTTGCPPNYRPPIDFSDKNTLQGKFNQYLKNEQIRYLCYRDGKDITDGTTPSCATTSISDGPARAKTVRNELIDTALSYIDKAYGDFKNDLTAGRDRINFVADLVELGTAAAVGITKGERPIQIIGIALTAFRGGRSSADANFFRNQSTPVLISKMNGERARIHAIILDNEKKEIDTYDIGMAVSDIVDYYNAGTLIEAFNKLNEDTAAQTKQSEKDLADLKQRLGVLPAPTEEEIRISKANAAAIDALSDAYVEADNKVAEAERNLTDANHRITDATQEITDATQRIANAQAKIDAENAKQNPAQAVITQANTDKTVAEADKTRAEADKTKAETDKATAETAKTTATAARDTALSNLKGTYEAIEADPALSPLLDKIPDLPGYSASFKARLQASLQRLKEKKPITTAAERQQRVEDYALIMLQVGKIVRLNLSKDPTLNERLQTILKVNK
jgi:hypothetical protein